VDDPSNFHDLGLKGSTTSFKLIVMRMGLEKSVTSGRSREASWSAAQEQLLESSTTAMEVYSSSVKELPQHIAMLVPGFALTSSATGNW